MIEYILLICEYCRMKGLKGLLVNSVIPLSIGGLIYFKADENNYKLNAPFFHSNLITMLCILIGFTISTLTMLLTVSNPNIELAKTALIGKKIYSRQLTLFDSIITGLAYIILVQGLLLIANLIYPIFISILTSHGKMLFALNISIVIHIIFILLRNILDFYFIVTKNK